MVPSWEVGFWMWVVGVLEIRSGISLLTVAFCRSPCPYSFSLTSRTSGVFAFANSFLGPEFFSVASSTTVRAQA